MVPFPRKGDGSRRSWRRRGHRIKRNSGVGMRVDASRLGLSTDARERNEEEAKSEPSNKRVKKKKKGTGEAKPAKAKEKKRDQESKTQWTHHGPDTLPLEPYSLHISRYSPRPPAQRPLQRAPPPKRSHLGASRIQRTWRPSFQPLRLLRSSLHRRSAPELTRCW